jgi:hypothetical protein
MTKTIRSFSEALAVLILAAVIAPLLSGQEMDDQDRLPFQKFRMTRPDLIKGEGQLKKKQFDKALEYLEKAEAAGTKVKPEFKKAVLQALGK